MNNTILAAFDEFECYGDCGRLVRLVADGWQSLDNVPIGDRESTELLRVATEFAEEEIARLNLQVEESLRARRLDEARRTAEEALAQIRCQFGWEDERYAIQLEKLSAIYLCMGKVIEAHDVGHKARFLREHTSNREAPASATREQQDLISHVDDYATNVMHEREGEELPYEARGERHRYSQTDVASLNRQVRRLVLQRNYELASEPAARALELARRGATSLELARSLNNLSTCCFDSFIWANWRPEVAAQYSAEAISLLEYSENDNDRWESSVAKFLRGHALGAMGCHQRGLRLLLDAKRGLACQREHPFYIFTLKSLASSYCALKRWTLANEILLQGIDLARHVFGNRSVHSCNLLQELAHLRLKQGQFRDACQLVCQTRGMAKWDRRGHRLLTKIYLTWGSDYYDNAESEVWSHFRTFGDEATFAYWLGVVCSKRRQWRSAEKYLNDAIAKTSQTHFLASCYEQLAVNNFNQGELEKAEASALQLLKIQRDLLPADSIDTALTVRFLGAISFRGKHYEVAERLYREANERAKRSVGQNVTLAKYLNDLGRTFAHLGKITEAKDIFARALTVRSTHAETTEDDVVQMLSTQGVYFIDNSLPQDAEPILRDALLHAPGCHDPGNVMRVKKCLGRVLFDQNKEPDEAFAFYEEALAVAKSLGASEEVQDIYYHLGVIRYRQRQFEDAVYLFDRAVRVDVSEASPYSRACWLLLSYANFELNWIQQAIEAMKQAIRQHEKSLGEHYENWNDHWKALVAFYICAEDFTAAASVLREWISRAEGDEGAIEKALRVQISCWAKMWVKENVATDVSEKQVLDTLAWIDLQSYPYNDLRARCLQFLASIYRKEGKLQQAEALLLSAKELTNDKMISRNLWNGLGLTYRDMGQGEVAERCFQKALEIGGENELIRNHLEGVHLEDEGEIMTNVELGELIGHSLSTIRLGSEEDLE